MSQSRTLVAGALLTVSIVIASGCGQQTTTSQQKSGTAPDDKKGAATPGATASPAATAATRSEPAFKGKAEDLLKEFAAGQPAADKKYKDKYVEVEGIVESAPSAGSQDKMGVAVPADPHKAVIVCDMSADALKTFLQLGRGQKVKVVGKEYLSIPGTVYLNDCTYSEAGPNPAIRVSAKELGTEFAKDEGKAAAQKYTSKDVFHPTELIVEGTVLDVGESKDPGFSGLVVKLDAGMQEPMVCQFSKFDEAAAKQLKKGDVAVLKGGFRANMLALKNYPSLTNAVVLKKP
jgi:hypothetical protein